MRHFSGWMRPAPFAIWVASICALLGAISARAQNPQAAQGPPIIKSIDVQYTGPGTLSRERILAQMRTKVGQPYSDQVVEQDIETLYKTGSIRDVRIFAQPEVDGVKVIVAVQTRSIVREIEIDGAEQVKAKRLRKEIKLKLNQPVNEQQLEEARQKIIEVYQGRGYNDVSVQFRVDAIDEKRGTARVVFTVNEGVKGAVRQVHFEGNQHFNEKVLRKQMKTRGKTLLYFLDKSGRLDEVQLQQDLDKIREWYQNHGYIDVQIKDVRKERTKNGPMILTIVIAEGSQYHVGKLTISGYHVTSEEKIRALLKMKEGSVYSPKQLRDDAKAVADAYGSGGYVDLIILVQEKRTGSLTFGGGFSTIDKLVGFAELTQGNFDLLNWPGFTGAGQKFRLRIQYGTQRKDFILVLTEPYFLDRRLALSGQVFYDEANYLSAQYDQRNYGFAIELRKPLNAYMYATLGYRLQDVDIFNVDPSASEAIQSQEGSTLESQIFSSLVFDRRDNPLLTRRGQRVTLSPYIAGGFLGGDTQIYGFDLEGSQYFPFRWDTILLINGEIATVSTWGSGNQIPGSSDQVPIFERLFLGGSNNLRGFPFREVGPQDQNGEPLGGNSMARATVEFTFPIIEKARGAIFYDTG